MGAPRPPATLQEQLAPLAARLRETRATIRPVSQVIFRLKPVVGKDRFTEAVGEVLRWMDKRAGRRLPDAAWERKSFELADVGSQRTAAVALDDPRYWAARLDDADKSVPLRTWVTEIGVGVVPDGDVLFGVRLICATRGADVPFERTVPGFVRGVLRTGPADVDGIRVGTECPRVVSSEDDVEDLLWLLEKPDRRAPVIVLALPDGSADVQKTVCPAAEITQRTLGAAHVIVLSGPASFHLTDRVGRELSVFRQAVRVYRPGFSTWRDQPARHPLFLPARVETWRLERATDDGKPAFTRWLIEQILAASVHRSDRDDELPPFTVVRQMAAQAERDRLRKSGSSVVDLVRLFEEDNVKLRGELKDQREEYEGLLNAAEKEREDAQLEAQEVRAQTFGLRARIRALETRLSDLPGAAAEPPIPESLENFQDWCRKHLAGSIEIHNRALQGIKKSVYEDLPLIYRALLALRDYYVPMRLEGGKARVEAFEAACRALKIEDAPVGDALRTHRDQYTISYGGRPRLLERHLKKGKAHDEGCCFRLYYFWDDESQCVVVGWLPSHLESALT